MFTFSATNWESPSFKLVPGFQVELGMLPISDIGIAKFQDFLIHSSITKSEKQNEKMV